MNTAILKWAALCIAFLVAGLAPLPRQQVAVRIGSKKFTESVILGEMLRLLAADEDLSAAHYREFGGTRIVFQALEAGEIDAYPEYTGTIAQEILTEKAAPDDEAMRRALRARGMGMSGSLGFSNTYALALTRKRATELGIKNISDLRRFPELHLALTHEFLDRSDGWGALAERYDLPQRNVVGVDHDVAYPQLLAGEIDVTDVYSTDAMVHRNDLVLLEDDLKFFPRYDAVWLYRLQSAERQPTLLASIKRLEGSVSDDKMRALNDAVESGEQSESQVAANFLHTQLGVSAEPEKDSWSRVILKHVGEHLDLVRRSLLPAIVAGTGLGIFCQRFRRSGRVVLAVVGLLQTIPSLALLVLLMPLVGALGYPSVGEGSVTAVVALLAYCLFPIVRNTFTGLEGIPRGTIESATVLGLSPAAKLAEIELPMALPVMLAGIRTSAVQNVGFATLGAIIGAGGLGQPILRGIRLNDVKLILAGAIPAALLAVLLQVLIDWVERAVVARGLKGGPTAEQ
ncbi:MAG TPA: glycine betaine ABC transporter substrate-binding protein [Gemmataceae bacterium]|nr:glycine betaine ABC transporter substrate-binding protein [Gemmataceae bacterium]